MNLNRNTKLCYVQVAILLLLTGLITNMAFAQTADDPIVGTWYVKVAESTGGFPPFEAFHTFNPGGTFIETSSNLATLTEGPAHGVWASQGDGTYILTFQLFAFDSTQQAEGRIQVRVLITMDGNDHITANSVVDFIAPDGTMESNIDTAPFEGVRITPQGITTVQDNIKSSPKFFRLRQNFPNPFNPSTTIQYDLMKESNVQIIIYDAIGNQTRTLVNSEQVPGNYRIYWDGNDDYGNHVASGIYFYTMMTNNFQDTKKMIVLK